MPLTKSGHKILRIFEKEYGEPKGKTVFYSYINVHPTRSKKWHKKKRHSSPYNYMKLNPSGTRL